MMEAVEVGDHRSGQELITDHVPVQIVSEARVEVISKMAPVTVNASMMPSSDLMTAQYINLHRMPEQLNKVLVSDPISGELLAHHVDLSASADFGQHTVTAQYYDPEELLAHGLTEEDRRIAAELVAVQLKQQQQQGTTILTAQDLLNAKAITSLGQVSIDKPTLSAAIVTGYIHTVDEAVQHQLLQQHDSQDRCIMKIYPTQTAGSQELQVLNRQTSQPLPPLKKVLSSQSMMVRNKFSTSSGIMVELQNSELLDAGTVTDDCIKPEDLEEPAQVAMTTGTSVVAARPAAPTTTVVQTSVDELDSDYDAENDAQRPSRKSMLPHKKRIPRKLKAPPTGGSGGGGGSGGRSGVQKTYKCNKCGESFSNQAALASHRLVHAHSHAPAKTRPASNLFSCELCQKQFSNQLKFFEHLKQHYEPSQPAVNRNGMPENSVTTSSNIVTQVTSSHHHHHHHNHNHHQQQQIDEQHLNHQQPPPPPHLTPMVQSSVQACMTSSLEEQITSISMDDPLAVKSEVEHIQNSVKEEVVTSTGLACGHCGKTFRRQKALETHVSVAHPRQDEIEEFSEPEDMMEGIRHVVNIPTVDSGDEEHIDDKLRWRYQVNAVSDYSSIQDLGMDLQEIQTLEAAEAAALPESDAQITSGGGGASDKSVGGGKMAAGGGDGSVDGEGSKRTLACVQCNRVFNHRNSLLYHLRSHSGLRPHQCEVCGKGFISGSALKVHMRLHSGDKPYKCEHCNRHFRQWGDLKYHVTSLHSDQKQFQCEYCGKDFARKYSLNVHRRIHTGEKNYKCEFCSKTFRASSYLQNHRRIHTGEKPHLCDICGKPFRVRSDMKRHRHTHNKERPIRQSANAPTHSNSPLDDHDDQESSETILPDSAPTPLNLNIRHGDHEHHDHEHELVYTATGARGTTHTVDRDSGTLYVWIPAAPDSILSDE